MTVIELLAKDVSNAERDAQRAQRRGDPGAFQVHATTYHRLANFYFALTGVELRPAS